MIDANRWYTNGGPLVQLFEKRLASEIASKVCPSSEVVTSANGTIALIQAMKARFAGPTRDSRHVICPSWTFVATAAAVVASGFDPYFCDVDEATWSLTPKRVREHLEEDRDLERSTAGVVVVSPFGAPLDLAEWARFTEDTGIAVVVDGAAAFDSIASGWWPKLPAKHQIPIVVSLHATKVFGVGEGGAVIAPSPELAQKVRAWGNFGFDGPRESKFPGLNGKMSEYSAAVGLAMLDSWPVVRQGWLEVGAMYQDQYRRLPETEATPVTDSSWASAYSLLALRRGGRSAERVMQELSARGIESRPWWGRGCHREQAFSGFARSALPVTEALGDRVVGLPFWRGISPTQVEFLFGSLREILRGDNDAG